MASIDLAVSDNDWSFNVNNFGEKTNNLGHGKTSMTWYLLRIE